MWIIIFILNAIVFGSSTSYIAGQKGKNKRTWFFLGAFLGIIGLLIIGFSKETESTYKNFKTSPNYNKKELIDNKTFNLTTDLDSPIDILWNSINIENDNIFLYSSFKNISNKKIISIMLTVQCFDSFNGYSGNESNSLVEHVIQDLNLFPSSILDKDLFIDLSHLPSTRKVNIVIEKVLFEDKSIWVSSKTNIVDTEANMITDTELLDNIREINGSDIICASELKADKWICTCGRNNHINSDLCVRCNSDKETIINNFSMDMIINKVNQYKKKLEAEQKMLLEEQEENKKKRKVGNAKKRRKFFIISTPVVLVILGIIFFTLILPNLRINKARTFMEQGKYSEAISLYERAVNKFNLNDDIRKNIVEAAKKSIFKNEDYENSIKAISILESNDEKYRDTYRFIIDQYKNSGKKITAKLIYQMSHGRMIYDIKTVIIEAAKVSTDDYDILIKAIYLLKDNDGEHESMYNLIINNHEKGNKEIANQLITQVIKGNFESGEIRVKTSLTVGLDLGNSTIYNRFRKYSQKIDAEKIISYSNGKLSDDVKYSFISKVAYGSETGWSEEEFIYEGEIVDNVLEGKGTLYIKTVINVLKKDYSYFKYDYADYIKIYEGEFKKGRYEGYGTLYWDRLTYDQYFKMKFPENGMINDNQKLLVADFKDGNIYGSYTSYYDDGKVDDSGTSHNGIKISEKYGKEDYSNRNSKTELPDDIELVE